MELRIIGVVCFIIAVVIFCFVICSMILDYISSREDKKTAEIIKDYDAAKFIREIHENKGSNVADEVMGPKLKKEY